MSTPPRRFFAGETESKAVIEAAGHFGLSPGELAYRPVDKKHGFLRRPRVVIEVDPLSPRRLAGVPSATPAAVRAGQPAAPVPAAPRPVNAAGSPPEGLRRLAGPSDAQGPEGAVAAAAALAALAALRVDVTAAVAVGASGEEIRVEMQGADRDAVVARQGELLHACEYLLRRMVRELPEGGLALDSGGFRGERDETLRRRAASAADEVRRSGEPVLFEPLPAAERRVVHVTIQDEPGVASASEGEGEVRRVRVFPAGDPPAGS